MKLFHREIKITRNTFFRSSTYSLHVSRTQNEKEYWNFNLHQLGQIDNPAMINHVLMQTNRQYLHYVGFSAGTTSFFIMGSLYQEMSSKVKSMHALAPIAYNSNVEGFLRVLYLNFENIANVLKSFGRYEIISHDDFYLVFLRNYCKLGSTMSELCKSLLNLQNGYDPQHFDQAIIPNLFEVFPQGASVEEILHYSQLYKSGKFRQFDYGVSKNLEVYGNASPPDYNLRTISTSVYLYCGGGDRIIAEEVSFVWVCFIFTIQCLISL